MSSPTAQVSTRTDRDTTGAPGWARTLLRQDPPATECGPAKRPSGGEEDGSGARAHRALADAGSALADRGEPYGWPPPGVMAPLPVTLVVTCFGLPP